MWGLEVSKLDLIRNVNADVNSTPYCTDMENYGSVEFWECVPTPLGFDCEGYAIDKLRKLLAAGLDIKQLRLATCGVKDPEDHCVLLVDLDGTWVLDSNYPHPIESQMYRHKFIRLQIAGTPEWEWA